MTLQTLSLNAISTITHPNPYPFYADLVANRPIYWDETLRIWIASSASAVTAVLTNELCRVRPISEPVPKALLGSPAAQIFRSLIRMNDGQNHCPFKQAVSITLDSINPMRIAEQSRKWSRHLISERGLKEDDDHLSDFAYQLSVYVMGSLLGVSEADLPQTALWVGDFVKCLSPISSPEQIERGKAAAGELFRLFHDLLSAQQSDNLLTILAQQAAQFGRDDADVVVANGIGFLSQAYEATAGLIGSTLLALASQPGILERIMIEPAMLQNTIMEVLRYNPPIQNTRRFLAQDGMVAAQAMKAGDTILVVLAAANRDPQANPHPERFDLSRTDRQIFTFGAGVHACPGAYSAVSIAQAAVENLLVCGLDFQQLAESVIYQPSVNARIPLFISVMGTDSEEKQPHPSIPSPRRGEGKLRSNMATFGCTVARSGVR